MKEINKAYTKGAVGGIGLFILIDQLYEWWRWRKYLKFHPNEKLSFRAFKKQYGLTLGMPGFTDE